MPDCCACGRRQRCGRKDFVSGHRVTRNKDKSCRPTLADASAPVEDAEVIFVGYPVWWYREPSIIDSFLEAYDFSGKTIVLFAASGGSDLGKEAPARAAEIAKTAVKGGRHFSADTSEDELKAWAEQFLK